ncbi:hypothetical protein RJT34_22415 [Clitoria ternatea]|uniref:Remorin C-terminal domain-containing protein n=1 Tax=Clitoria ternatea TaxID=43366 RepID=A0AAN9IV89_CLITE
MSIFQSQSSNSSSYSTRNCINSNKKDTMHPTWSMSSLFTTLPQSPSATEFSNPRNQSDAIAWRINQDNNNNNNFSTCFADIDEWLEHANKFCKSSNHLTESVDFWENGSIEEDSRLSAVCNTYLMAPNYELYNIELPSVREESPVHHGQNCLTRAPKCVNRQGHYDQLLGEVRRRKHEAERDAHKKAKQVELMHSLSVIESLEHTNMENFGDECVDRMRRKEIAIDDWESHQTRKAMDKMDKIQACNLIPSMTFNFALDWNVNELERQQLRALARTQKKIGLVREKAEKQKLKLRRSAMKKLKHMQTDDTQSPSETSLDLPPLLSC